MRVVVAVLEIPEQRIPAAQAELVGVVQGLTLRLALFLGPQILAAAAAVPHMLVLEIVHLARAGPVSSFCLSQP